MAGVSDLLDAKVYALNIIQFIIYIYSDTDFFCVCMQLQSLPRFQVSRHSPMDYEKVLASRKDDLKQEEFPSLLLFPQQDVTVRILDMNLISDCIETDGDY